MPLQKFYSYLWLRKDGSPYYAGKGSGKRAYNAHEGFRAPKDKSRILIFPQDTEDDAFESEKLFIELFGRKDKDADGLLRNLTDGGEGASGYSPSTKTRAKMSAARIGRKMSPAFCEKMKEIWKNSTPERKEKIRKLGQEQGRKKVESGELNRIQHLPQTIEAHRKVGIQNRENGHIYTIGHLYGPKQGRKNVESGHLASIQSLGGRRQAELGHCARIAHLGGQKSKETGNASALGKSGVGRCVRWNIKRGKPCTCGKHEKGESIAR